MADDAAEVEIREVVIPDPSPTREVSPIQFLGPHGTPPADRDFRPVPFVFKNDDDEVEEANEDGHGNMRKTEERKIRHPSEPDPARMRRIRGSQEQLDLSQAPKQQSQENKSAEGPKQAPGIAGTKQGQSSES